MVLSLLLVFVCASLGAAFTQLASARARQQSHAVAQLQAFYVAEAGLAEAFCSVRMGRSGRIADEVVPGRFGGADVWVDAYESDDTTVFLRSTARKHRSDVSLGLVVRPEPPALGFFADEDLVIEDVVLVDGFDSTERSYQEEVATVESQPTYPQESVQGYTQAQIESFLNGRAQRDGLIDALGTDDLTSVLSNQIKVTQGPDGDIYTLFHRPIDIRDRMTSAQFDTFIANGRDVYDTFVAGHLFDDAPLVATASGSSALLETVQAEGGWSGFAPDAPERLLGHTLQGGLLGSNGDVTFQGAATDAEVHGSVTPGVDGAVIGIRDDAPAGSTDSRSTPAELEEVLVPSLVSQGDLTIDSGLPLVLSAPTARYGDLTVGANEDLVLRGPMTLVVDKFSVHPGAALELDTTLGDVEIFVRESMDLSPQAVISTTGTDSREVSIRAETGVPDSALALEAAGAFSGAIYAPDSEVLIGTNFEVFGGVVARRLVIQSGARLHFDHEGYDGALPLPSLETWRLLELPGADPAVPPSGSEADASLSRDHDLAGVELKITFIDLAGNERKYKGPEADFDYATVDEVVRIKRKVDKAATATPVTPDWLAEWLENTRKRRDDIEATTEEDA